MLKRLFVMIVIGAAGFAAWNAAHPAPVAATTADVTANVDDSFSARLKQKIGVFTAGIVGNQIRTATAKTEDQLALLGPAMKKTGGLSGRNARELSLRIIALDSLSIASLDAAHPVTAIRQAMDARGYIDMIRQDVSDETAAR